MSGGPGERHAGAGAAGGAPGEHGGGGAAGGGPGEHGGAGAAGGTEALARAERLLAEASWYLWPGEVAIASFPREARSQVLARLVPDPASAGPARSLATPPATAPDTTGPTCSLAADAGQGPLSLPGSSAGPVWWGDGGFELTVVAPVEMFGSGRALGDIPGGRVDGGWALLTCLTPLPWDVVGFLAGVTTRLARAGITCGAFSAYARDHLLVPWARKGEVLRVLRGEDQPRAE